MRCYSQREGLIPLRERGDGIWLVLFLCFCLCIEGRFVIM